MKLNTVNVIEYAGDSVVGVSSFSNDKDGIKEAEELFKSVLVENGLEATEIEACIEDGWYEQGDYQVFLTHSC